MGTVNRSTEEVADAIGAVGELWGRIASALVATAQDHVEVDRRVAHRIEALTVRVDGVDVPQVGN
ncbi:hypothetical protein [Nocardioides yefusunii]|uniref:Uncharacterized protein n=1 Tax=Nocardioides yefusunii TaxID=2500546 RepID=A0ABW1QY38_9ACTN|nr:hypothetical protein [Nocardioides yefusunii]